MTQFVTATFEDGMFKPDASLNLPAHTRVRLTVEPILEQADRIQAWKEFEELLEVDSVEAPGRKFTRDELHDRD